MQHSQVVEWLNHPVSKVLIKKLEENRTIAVDMVANLPDDAPRDQIIRLLKEVKVLSDLIQIEEFLIDEEIDDA